jgi:hypothetical protein
MRPNLSRLRHHCRLDLYYCGIIVTPTLLWYYAASCSNMRPNSTNVGRTSSLHYYYLVFIVLTYLAYLIAVNTIYISSLGTTDLGIQAPCCIILGYLEKVRKAHFLLLLTSRINSFNLTDLSILINQFSLLTDTFCISCHAQCAPDQFRDSNQSRFRGKLEDLTGTSNTLL